MNLFDWVRIGLYIVFVGVILATPFIIAKRIDVDLIALIKKWMGRGRSDREGQEGKRKSALKFEFPRHKEIVCEVSVCEENAGENGAVVKHKNGTRKIVCAECAAAHIRLGWKLEMGWGDSFKSNSPVVMIVGGKLLTRLFPLFYGEAPTLLSVNNPDPRAFLVVGVVILLFGVMTWGMYVFAVSVRAMGRPN